MNVAVIGCGVRGSIVAALLGGAGVEELSLVDGGLIGEGDVACNPLAFAPDLNVGKADALVAKLSLIAPAVMAVPFPAALTVENATAILSGVNVVVDCTGDGGVAGALLDATADTPVELVASPFVDEEVDFTVPVAVEIAARQAQAALALRA